MVQFSKSLLVFGALAASTHALPLAHQKRIAQVITAATAKWEQACLAAGGGQKCNPASVTAFSTLLAAPGPCEQQNAADQMIDLAKTLKNNAELIKLTQIFAQQPRNTPSSQSVPYCQEAPKNSELNGLFQCQFEGADKKTFVGGLAAGSPGTVPFGLKSLNPAGSCKANPDGPIADGSQLVDITQDPGVGEGGQDAPEDEGEPEDEGNPEDEPADEGNPEDEGEPEDEGAPEDEGNPEDEEETPEEDTEDSGEPAADTGANNGGNDTCGNGNSKPSSSSAKPPKATPAAGASTGNGNTGAGGFKLQNGKDAQKLNAEFEGLSTGDSCNDGDQACVDGGFAQCVGGKFVVTQCAGGTTCLALPLVNKPGTSIACTTEQDGKDRIAATGATGGISG